MKRMATCFTAFAATLLLAGAITAPCFAGGPVKGQEQQQVQLEMMPPPFEEPSDTASVIKNFFEDMKRILMQQYIPIEIWDDFESKLLIKIDPDNGAYYMKYKNNALPLPDGGTSNFSFSIDFIKSDSASDPGQEAYFEFFPGIGLLALVNVDADTTEMEQAYYELVFTKLYMVRLADPAFADDFMIVAKDGMDRLIAEFSNLEGDFKSLKGFSKGVNKWSSDNRPAFGFSFEKNLGPATMGDPVGKLMGDDSIYVGFSIAEYEPLMNRWTTGSEARHFNLTLENLNMEISWTVESEDEGIEEALYKYVKGLVDELVEIDEGLYRTKIKKRATEFWPEGDRSSADTAPPAAGGQDSIDELADSFCAYLLEDNLPGLFDLMPRVQQQEFADRLSMTIEEFRDSRPAGAASQIIESCDVISTSADRCDKILPFLYDHWETKYGEGPENCGVMKIKTKMTLFAEAQTQNQYAIENGNGWKAIAANKEFE